MASKIHSHLQGSLRINRKDVEITCFDEDVIVLLKPGQFVVVFFNL
jgi:hypothetical protein